VTVPNAITIGRIALIPCFALLWWRGEREAAFLALLAAGLSDLADGFLARVLNQRSRLGQLLDPIADKLLLLCAFIVAALDHAVPVWLLVMILVRDGALAAGGLLFTFVWKGSFAAERWRPSRLGKYATFTQVLTVLLALLCRLSQRDDLLPYVAVCVLAAAVLTTLSGVQYVAAGVQALKSTFQSASSSES
jgi:cardiolipin synthase